MEDEEVKFHIKILSKDVKPYWYSLGQLKLMKIVKEYKKDKEIGNNKKNPIIIGLQNPQYSRIYEQIQGLSGVYPAVAGNIVEFDELFYNVYIRVKLIQRRLNYGRN